MPPIVGEVEFKNVCFSYEDGVPILNNVSFKVNPGDTIAIVGPIGAGKTTIINLISRFYNLDSGIITIDGIDISEVKIRSLRKQMGVMLQDSFLFSGTIMDNIRYGNMEADDNKVIEVARTVRAHDFIIKLENAYDTEVNERGTALCRSKTAYKLCKGITGRSQNSHLTKPPPASIRRLRFRLQEGLKRLLKGRTSFIIAHRLSTIKNATCILYVDDGRIMEMGTHDELISRKGLYYELYLSQYQFL